MLERYEKALEAWQALDAAGRGAREKELTEFGVRFAYHSVRLERQETSFCAARQIFLGTLPPERRAEEALAPLFAEHECWLLFGQCAGGRPVDAELALALNAALCRGLEKESGLKPEAADGLAELLREVGSYTGPSILKAGTYLHAAFLYDCPFGRYNGRTARWLLNCYLISRGHPPLVFFCYDRRMYYECMVRYFEQEELEPLYNFLQYEAGRSWLAPAPQQESALPQAAGV